MKIIASFLTIAMLSTQAFAAEDLKNVKATKRLAENIITLVDQGNVDGAFKEIKAYWPLVPEEADTLLAHTRDQRKKITERFGKSLGVEFIRTDQVGNSLVRHVFIEKFERHALRWYLSFYKPNDNWLINNVYWDDKISDLYTPT